MLSNGSAQILNITSTGPSFSTNQHLQDTTDRSVIVPTVPSNWLWYANVEFRKWVWQKLQKVLGRHARKVNNRGKPDSQTRIGTQNCFDLSSISCQDHNHVASVSRVGHLTKDFRHSVFVKRVFNQAVYFVNEPYLTESQFKLADRLWTCTT
jgi:hypothetical protein